jgi:hypothetical protein
MRAGLNVSRVTRSLYARAVGYNYEAVKIFMPAMVRRRASICFLREIVTPALGEFLQASLFALFGHQPLTPLQSGSRHTTGPGDQLSPGNGVTVMRMIPSCKSGSK